MVARSGGIAAAAEPVRDRFLFNLILACTIIVLVTIAYWRPRQEALVDAPRISSLQAEDVQTIDLHRRGQQPMTFRRGGDGWRLTTPSAGVADQNKVSALLDILDTRGTATLASVELERFELNEPRATLRFDKELWSFGASHPLDGRRYVLHEGTIHLIDNRFFHHLIGEPRIYAANHEDAPLLDEDAVETVTDPAFDLMSDSEPP